jgi:succinate dehydrogenase flavin-adding protein (antitoxin of CptAB toxin-antitoxin module)
MTLVRTVRRVELEDNFNAIVQQCGIDSPGSKEALQRILKLRPAVSTVRFYQHGGPDRISISPGTAAVILATSGRGPHRRLKVNGVRVFPIRTNKIDVHKRNRRFQEMGKMGGSCSAAASPAKAAALEALFARRRGKRISDPGVSPDRLVQIMRMVQDVTRVQFQPERVSKRALARYLGVSDRTIGRWISGHRWPDKRHVRKILVWLRHINPSRQSARAIRISM